MKRNMMLKKKYGVGLSILIASGMMIVVPAIASASSRSEAVPNVLFILADDLGYEGLGCFGNEFLETPHLDRMAQQGMKFTNGLAPAPTCLPSRAAILSGQYSPRTGCYRVADKHKGKEQYLPFEMPENHGLALENITIAEQFKSAGYTTAVYGKWHANFYRPQLHPRYQGFDEAIEIGGHYKARTDPKGLIQPEVNSADFITDKAIGFMEKSVAEDQPFFLYLPYYLVHAPLESIPEYVEHFKHKLADRPILSRQGLEGVATVAAMTKHLDDCAGRLFQTLEKLGIEKDTLIVFTSDNGCFQEDYNGDLRAKKGDHYEGGMRVPYIFKWAGVIPENSTCDERIIGVDLYPTFLELAGIERASEHPLDGVSLRSLLDGSSESLQERALYCFHPKADVFQKNTGRWRWPWENVMYLGDYKLLERPFSSEIELYNLKTDGQEKHDLAKVEPERLQNMTQQFQKWKRDIGAPTPVENLGYDLSAAK